MDVYYDYLEQEILAPNELWRQRILLVRATIAYLIRHSQEVSSLKSALPPNLGNVAYIFFPINDNNDPTTGHGGSHWSLLVVNRGIKIGFHYDSLNQRNDEVAKETLGKISVLLNEQFHYVRQPSPQQENVSDCGVHVLYNTRVLIQRLMVPAYRPERPWDLSDIDPDTSSNRAALRQLFQQKLGERLDRESP